LTAPEPGQAAALAIEVLSRLEERGETLAVAESCTGGGLGSILTAVPGASAAFIGGVIAYSDSVKLSLLGVDPSTLASHGAVSSECAQQMADGVRTGLSVDWGLSITGIAGPEGGSPEKPVGTVWIGLAGPGQRFGEPFRFGGDREKVRRNAVSEALRLLVRSVETDDA
jgi:nicotinamide-nucleotide amidase